MAALVGQRHQVAPLIGNKHVQLGIGGRGGLGNGAHEPLYALAGASGHELGARIAPFKAGQRLGVQQIAFVEGGDCGNALGPYLVEHLAHGLDLPLELRRGGIDHVQDKVGSGDFVERRLEGLDQRGGQLLDEADGVGDGDLAALGQLELAGGGVQRGEELVVAEHIGSGEPVDERAFPALV